MVKRLATSRHDPLGISDSACKNKLVMVSVQYDPFNPYIPIRSTTIGKSRVARDPIAMHTSWRSNSDIASVTRQNIRYNTEVSQKKLGNLEQKELKKSAVHDKHISSILFISLQLPTANYLHSMKTSEPKAQQGYIDPSIYNPDPSLVFEGVYSPSTVILFLPGDPLVLIT
ncbi:hypothetical protein F511_18833 [Dorcoceras hygrometricum]|uniref:Uncharacterized protein n=1 Tax=Dorcoceras hygrometricum TaxID=472368 RepID=A0A2Z7D9T8_9LAMI|nr:hypothetical protein F511_18833 [Dorcoceras hygrometricum]